MGTRKRPSRVADAKMDERLNDWIVAPSPSSLSKEQLDPDNHPIHHVPAEQRTKFPVHAWVDFPAVTIRPTGYAVAWTDRAVQVAFPVNGRTVYAWVWANAVDRVAQGGGVVDPLGTLEKTAE